MRPGTIPAGNPIPRVTIARDISTSKKTERFPRNCRAAGRF